MNKQLPVSYKGIPQIDRSAYYASMREKRMLSKREQEVSAREMKQMVDEYAHQKSRDLFKQEKQIHKDRIDAEEMLLEANTISYRNELERKENDLYYNQREFELAQEKELIIHENRQLDYRAQNLNLDGKLMELSQQSHENEMREMYLDSKELNNDAKYERKMEKVEKEMKAAERKGAYADYEKNYTLMQQAEIKREEKDLQQQWREFKHWQNIEEARAETGRNLKEDEQYRKMDLYTHNIRQAQYDAQRKLLYCKNKYGR